MNGKRRKRNEVFVSDTRTHMDTTALLAKSTPPARQDENRTFWTDVLAGIPLLKEKLAAASFVPVAGKTVRVRTATGEIEVPAMQEIDKRPYKDKLATFRTDLEA